MCHGVETDIATIIIIIIITIVSIYHISTKFSLKKLDSLHKGLNINNKT